MSQQSDVTSVGSLDLNRYSGPWYEVGRLPLRWEDADASDITAEYTPEGDGSVRVDNRCIDIDKAGRPRRRSVVQPR
jgi:apolipoprotein D and lipocalin family protein